MTKLLGTILALGIGVHILNTHGKQVKKHLKRSRINNLKKQLQEEVMI